MENTETSLYSGSVVLKFASGNHSYYANGKRCQGVTSTLKKLYDQSALLEWYSSMASGDIVKAVAQSRHDEALDRAFLDIYEGKVPVHYPISIERSFAWPDLLDLYTVGKQAPLKRSQFGKDVGTQTHEAVDRYHKTGEAFIDETGIELNDQAAQKSLDMYVKWFKNSGLEVIASEVMVYSRELNYAGTLDRIYKDQAGNLIMGDFKTSNLSRNSPLGIQPSYWSQLGAYMKAYIEEHGVTFTDAVIVNSPKNGTIKIGYASDMGITPEDCIKTWLDDFQYAQNHKKIEYAQRSLKSRA